MSDMASTMHGTLLCDRGVHAPTLLPPLLLSHGISQLTPLGGSGSFLASPAPQLLVHLRRRLMGARAMRKL